MFYLLGGKHGHGYIDQDGDIVQLTIALTNTNSKKSLHKAGIQKSRIPWGYVSGKFAEGDHFGNPVFVFVNRKMTNYAVCSLIGGSLDWKFGGECGNGVLYVWRKGGKTHRTSGPARIEQRPGYNMETWFEEGEIHRDNNPAEILTGADGTVSRSWYSRGKLHRTDGPAQVTVTSWGTETFAWYVKGVQIHPQTRDEIILRHQMSLDWREWTQGEKLIMHFALG